MKKPGKGINVIKCSTWKFHEVHKVFGASNVSKMLQRGEGKCKRQEKIFVVLRLRLCEDSVSSREDIPVAQREDAAASLEYEAQATLKETRHPGGPEGGCSGQSGDIPVAQREDAVASLEYEAQARLRDPVYGCVGVICLLQKEMVALQEQLKDIEASSLSSSPNATHSSTISGNGAMYGIESSAAAVPSVGAAREEGGEC
ncbi:unnamed protein product [Closterium sp. NIES-64]|nr:unnamed protein product [Closterium sp. NIES-64]